MSSDRIDASFSTTGSAEGEELSRRRNVPVFGAASNQQHPSLDHPVSEDYKMSQYAICFAVRELFTGSLSKF